MNSDIYYIYKMSNEKVFLHNLSKYIFVINKIIYDSGTSVKCNTTTLS